MRGSNSKYLRTTRIIVIAMTLIFVMVGSAGCGKEPDNHVVSPEITASNSEKLIGTWHVESDPYKYFTFYLDGTGHCSANDLYEITEYSYKSNTLTCVAHSYWTNHEIEVPKSIVMYYTLEWLTDDEFAATDESGNKYVYKRKVAPTKEMITGYWLHNSGMYGFEAWYFAPDGTGWCYGMIKSENEGYVYGYSEISSWQITEDYRLWAEFSEISYWEYTEDNSHILKTDVSSKEGMIMPIKLHGLESLCLDINDVYESLGLLCVHEVTVSDDLKSANVKYLDEDIYYGYTPELITIIEKQ